MRTFAIASVTALVLLAVAPGCSVETEDAVADESEIVEKLPPASAAPMLDPEEVAFVKALNAYRKKKVGGEPLHVAIGLVKAARKHSKDMAAINAPKATHNDGGKGDQGPLRAQALRAASLRIEADYPALGCAPGEVPCGASWGEDCARRADIGPGAAAFELLKTNLGETGTPGFSDLSHPVDDIVPNMLADYFSDVGVARVKSSNGTWYWTVTYGDKGAPFAPMLSLDDSVDQSLLENGSFESPPKEFGRPTIGKGAWNAVARWYGPFDPEQHPDADSRRLARWHAFSEAGGSVTVRADNAFFLDGSGPPGPAHGLRIVDSPVDGATSHATQLVKAEAGVNYELTARTRKIGSDASQPAAYLDFVDAKYERIGHTTVKAGALPAWSAEPIRVSATAPARTAYVRVILYAATTAGSGSTYDWDDVRLRAW